MSEAPAESVPPGYQWTDLGILPSDWEVAPLVDLFDFRNGVNADKSAYGSGIPFVNVLEIITHSHLTADKVPGRISISDDRVSSYAVRTGDLLFNRTSETLSEVGLAAVYLDDRPIVFGGFVIRGRPKTRRLDPVFAGYALRAAGFRSQLIAKGQGAIRANIGQSDLNQVRVMLPPMSEQRAIAEALSGTDAFIAGLDKLIAKKRAIKHATMQQLLTGKVRLEGFDWEWEPKILGDFVSIRNDKTLPNLVPAITTCVELEHIGQGDGRLRIHNTADQSASMKYRFLAGDVLFGRLRPYLRKYWLADREGLCSTEIWPFIANCKLTDRDYLYYLVQTDRFIDSAGISYGTHMPRADWSVMRNLAFPLPSSLAEQRAIAAVLSDMDAEIEALECLLEKAKAIKQGMMQALLTGRVRLAPKVTAESGA